MYWHIEKHLHKSLDLLSGVTPITRYLPLWSLSDKYPKYIKDCEILTKIISHSSPGGGGGGTQYIHAEEGVFFSDLRMSAILQKKGTFLYPGTKYGGQNPLTINEIYAALTASDSRSNQRFRVC